MDLTQTDVGLFGVVEFEAGLVCDGDAEYGATLYRYVYGIAA